MVVGDQERTWNPVVAGMGTLESLKVAGMETLEPVKVVETGKAMVARKHLCLLNHYSPLLFPLQ